MFSDFLPTAGDALVEELPKFRFMSGGQCALPVTIRSIGGGGGRFGTQHSATGESWFMAFPGLHVATRRHAGRCVYGVCAPRSATTTPCSSSSTRRSTGARAPSCAARIRSRRSARQRRTRGSDVTIVATLADDRPRTDQAAEQLAAEGIDAEVIDLRWLRPLDLTRCAQASRRPALARRRGAGARRRTGAPR